MREYKIYKTDLGYGIYKRMQVWKLLFVYYLNWNNNWVSNKNAARTFYSRETAVSALLIMKRKDAKTD